MSLLGTLARFATMNKENQVLVFSKDVQVVALSVTSEKGMCLWVDDAAANCMGRR